MGFEPQTSNLPLVNVRKRDTKVNLAIAAGVVLFLVIGLFGAIWAIRKAERGEHVLESPPPAR